jgi:2-polyprenyl-6-methoxyphenol hydroxylase-like FAD-dependent oxidoreductase
MVLELEKLSPNARQWLEDRARDRGTSLDTEAVTLLENAVQERSRRERLFLAADAARIRVPGPLITNHDIEEAINWGRE